MRSLTAEQLKRLSPTDFIEPLARVLDADTPVETPLRTVHALTGEPSGGLYLMPAWTNEALVVKLATFFPANPANGLPAVRGLVLLIDRKTGEPLLSADAAEVTTLRTSATSALAASKLARADAETLLIVGAGALALPMARAHAAVRPLRRIIVWARRDEAAQAVAREIGEALPQVTASVADELAGSCRKADIVTCVTSATEPVVHGAWLREGAHVDLVGAHTPTAREGDDDVMRGAQVWIDSDAALAEAGDLMLPLASGALSREQIRGDLRALLAEATPARASPEQRTVFKTVGAAAQDLAAMLRLQALAAAGAI